MRHSGLLFELLKINPSSPQQLRQFSEISGVSCEALKYYNEAGIIPLGQDLVSISQAVKINPLLLQMKLGVVDGPIEDLIMKNADAIFNIFQDNFSLPSNKMSHKYTPVFSTKFGHLYQADCLDVLPNIDSESVDTIFADPPFNLKKLYPSGIDDNLKAEQYLRWCELWIEECIRLLKPGGSLFLWNLPKWNGFLCRFLNQRLTFRHWISVDMKYSLPIQGRLYPSHYSLLYYCKGVKPTTFHPDRLPMEICSSCGKDLKDYGGYKDKMNPSGINLTDVWYDIPPVRHDKYKGRKNGNELSIRLLDRIIELSTNEGDLVLDPFGGSGTTYVVSEIKNRKWIGMEIGPSEDIVNRFDRIIQETEYLNRIRDGYNCLFSPETLKQRIKQGRWTCESVRDKKIKINDINFESQLSLALHS
jgi:site-specific DNA-methyltransferase (adenine-specific)